MAYGELKKKEMKLNEIKKKKEALKLRVGEVEIRIDRIG